MKTGYRQLVRTPNDYAKTAINSAILAGSTVAGDGDQSDMSRRPVDDQNSYTRAKVQITGQLIAAGRALVGVGAADMARACGLSVERMAILEAKGSARVRSETEVAAIKRGLDHFGVLIIPRIG